ncbi:MAG: cytochrome c556 [Alphaproteobacteria bacterium]|jgi:cytochrome c556
MKRWLLIPAVFAVAGFAFGTSNFALAQDHGAVVKERLAIMKSVSGTLKRLGKSAKAGKVGGKDAARAAKALAGYKKFSKLFPAGSDSGMIKTRAKAEIWKDWAKFEGQAGKLVAALEGVQMAAAAGDAGAMGKAVKAARGVCGGCHKPFRGPKPKKM